MGNTINVTTEVSEITVVDETLTVNVTPEEYTIEVGDGPRGFDGDRYHTTSTSTLTIASSGTVTLTTVDKQLDYSTAQTVIVAHDIDNHMHGDVVSYNKTSGVLVLDLKHKSGSGTYSSWEVNLDGAVGIQGPQGPTGATGPQGPSGVVSVSSPITNSGTSSAAVIGFDQTAQDTTNDVRYARLGAANAFTVGGHTITNAAAAVVPLTVKGAASQSANLTEWQDSTSAILTRVSSSGQFVTTVQAFFGSGAASITNARMNVATGSASVIGAVVRGAASQSANLLEVQNSSGTVVAQVESSGTIRTTQQLALSGNVVALSTQNSGGVITLGRSTAQATNPGSNFARLYLRDGTNAGTLKLVVRAGAAGAETTILDNIPQ